MVSQCHASAYLLLRLLAFLWTSNQVTLPRCFRGAPDPQIPLSPTRIEIYLSNPSKKITSNPSTFKLYYVCERGIVNYKDDSATPPQVGNADPTVTHSSGSASILGAAGILDILDILAVSVPAHHSIPERAVVERLAQQIILRLSWSSFHDGRRSRSILRQRPPLRC